MNPSTRIRRLLSRTTVAGFAMAGLGAMAMLGSSACAQAAAQSAHADSGAVLRGRVVRQADGSPVAGAEILLVPADQHATTDSTGAYRFVGLRAGIALVQVRHVGFDVQRDTVNLSVDHENVRTYALAPQSEKLDTVRTVAAGQKYLSTRLRAFEERRLSQQGGYFISDSVFRRSESSTLANLIESRVPGVTLLQVQSSQVLVSTKKQCSGLTFLHSDTCKKGSPDCFVTIYLDGVLYYTPPPPQPGGGGTGPPPPDLSHALNPSEFAGAEFYADGASAPAGMHSNDQGCGSLWLWTRER
ncbi:MAG: carboxypeptidase regulatory-like domain-containing protein [Gemmatimonadales bacterium]